ncbi:MAG: hypothetical protein AAF213_11075 [Pseudomonadota bacterium]
MSEKLRTALQALDRELDRLQRTAKQTQQNQPEAAAEPARAPEPVADPKTRLALVAMRDRVDCSIEQLELVLKESAGGAR